MNAEDLMIGDWVYDTILQGYTRVKVLTARGIQGDIHDNIWDEKTFEPIPLTAEILEKNGFEKCNEDTDGAIQYEWGSPVLGIDIWINTKPYLLGAWRTWDGETVAYTMANELPINYVHELQHALRLCGIEKEITI